jgi:hypothetical protein
MDETAADRRTHGRRTAVAVVIGAGVLVALVALAILILADGPDRTTTGVVTTRELHRICVENTDSETECAHVDSPALTESFASGDCVEITVSAEGFLTQLARSDACERNVRSPDLRLTHDGQPYDAMLLPVANRPRNEQAGPR